MKLARRVTHPNVLRTYDIGEHAGSRFITLELASGRTLRDVLPRRMELPEVARIADAICAGLGAAHDAGIVHRDLKPSNVLLVDDGRILLSDFGIALLAHDAIAASRAGTPGYMAPEQLLSRSVDGRADIWALGVIVHELLAGQPPFARTDGRAGLGEAPRGLLELRPELPAALARVVATCLARDPAQRFGHPREVAAALAAALPAPARVSALARGARRTRVLAVLPLDGQSAPGNFANGFSALLASSLASEKLRVPVLIDTGAGDPIVAGRDVGAEAVVTGAIVREADDRLAIELRVLGTGDGLELLCTTFLCTVAELVGAAEEASRAIARALLIERKEEEAAVLDSSAVELYLSGLVGLRRRSRALVDSAIESFEAALARAPDDAAILSALAMSLARRVESTGAAVDLDHARSVALRAIACARDRGEPHLALAAVALMTGDIAEAARELMVAQALAPQLADVHERLGQLALEAVGPGEAIARFYTATTLDPTIALSQWWNGRAYALTGTWDRCDAIFARVPGDVLLLSEYFINRSRVVMYGLTPERVSSFVADLERAPAFDWKDTITAGVAAVLRGDSLADALHAVLPQADEASPRRLAYLATLRAELTAAMGRHDESIAAVADADAAGFADVVWLDRCPLLEPMRGRPAFRAIRERTAARALRVAGILAPREG